MSNLNIQKNIIAQSIFVFFTVCLSLYLGIRYGILNANLAFPVAIFSGFATSAGFYGLYKDFTDFSNSINLTKRIIKTEKFTQKEIESGIREIALKLRKSQNSALESQSLAINSKLKNSKKSHSPKVRNLDENRQKFYDFFLKNLIIRVAKEKPFMIDGKEIDFADYLKDLFEEKNYQQRLEIADQYLLKFFAQSQQKNALIFLCDFIAANELFFGHQSRAEVDLAILSIRSSLDKKTRISDSKLNPEKPAGFLSPAHWPPTFDDQARKLDLRNPEAAPALQAEIFSNSEEQQSEHYQKLSDFIENFGFSCKIVDDFKSQITRLTLPENAPEFANLMVENLQQLAAQREDGDLSFDWQIAARDLSRELWRISGLYFESKEYKRRNLEDSLEKTQQGLEAAENERVKAAQLDFFQEFRKFPGYKHQEFAITINQFTLFQELEKCGEIYLKGSALYTDLLALGGDLRREKDLDFEVHLADFAQQKNHIIELFNNYLEVHQQPLLQPKIGQNYLQFKVVVNGKELDFSFYDRSNLPKNDWVCGFDALRLEVQTKNGELNWRDIATFSTSLSAGFKDSDQENWPQNAQDLIKEFKDGHLRINYVARELLCNLVKRVENQLLLAEQVGRLYLNDEKFKTALDQDWSLVLRMGVDQKCAYFGIDRDRFNAIRQIIMPPRNLSPTSGERLDEIGIPKVGATTL